MTSLVDVPAPAKLNLFLHVLGRRPDGYHLLQSAFVLIDWADTLHFELRRDGLLRRHDLTVSLPTDDLCLRAAQALQRASGCALGCDISIDKQLPSGAGMGGGSSDAATTLLALNKLWGLNWPRSRLQALALPLGADVPFFVGGHNAWAEGVGEQLTPLSLSEHHMMVIKPACNISTKDIFSSPDLVRCNKPAIVTGSLASTTVQGAADELFHGFGRNDLQLVAEANFPEVAQAIQLLKQFFGNGRMTGSGSAVFATLASSSALVKGLVESSARDGVKKSAGMHNAAAAALNGKLPLNWVARVCRSLPHHPLRDWAAS